MAAVNLPDNPANGTTQTVGGITYTYNSSKGYWTAAASSGGGGGGGASVSTSDAAPGSPSDGDLWYDTDDGGMFVYYQDTDSSQWVEVIGSQGAAGPAGAAGADGGAGVASVYATVNALPTSGNTQGDMAHVTANNTLYFWNGSGWYKIALINTNPSISGVASAYALAIDGTATTITVTATDPEGLPITYSIASDTSGNIATVSQGTGASTNVFTITPSTNTAYAGSFTLTFRASDGVNIATAPATFTLQFSVSNSRYTTALITSVGANNAVNNSFDDKSTSDHTITANGNIHQTTFSPYASGGYSYFFDGSGDYLEIDDGTWLTLGNGNFCFETWIYNTATSGGSQYIFGQGNSSGHANSISAEMYINSNRTLTGGIYVGSQKYATSTGTIPTNTWTHVALVRNGANIQLYINGTKDGENTSAGTDSANDQSTHFSIGRGGEYNGLYFTGHITDFRFVKGSSVHTGNFTAPTERLTAITNTELLTCHLPYITDGSTNNQTVAINGNTKATPFAPFDAQQYALAAHGGSLHSDGSGDYLVVDASSDFDLGTSDFTIEGWVYPTSYGNANFLVGQNYFSSIVQINSGKLQFYSSPASAYIITAATDIPLNAWTHWAVVRNGNAWTIYLNGKSDATATNAADAGFDSTNPLHIMRWNNSNGTMAGNVADLRFVKGTAVYTSNFTPPAAPLSAITNTKLLVQSTDAGIIDKAQAIKSVKLMGDTKSSTTQSKYLTSSIYFDGNDHILMPAIELGSTDYTVECWAWISAQGGTAGIFSKGSPGGLSNITWSLEFSSSNNYVALYIYAANSGAYVITGSTNIITSSWNHIAVTRSGNETKLFINGTQDGSTYTSNYTVADGGGFYLGGGFYAPTSRTITGYMSDFRVTKGLARYTANFTPPTAALQG